MRVSTVIAGALLLVTQARDTAQPSAELGTAAIAGVVMARTASGPPQPARRAIVTLAGDGLPAGRSTITDDEGRFALNQLPAGRFMLKAAKPAYLPVAYGATRPGRAGAPIVLTAGSRILDLSLTLMHGAAIAGTIRNADGAPVNGATVSAFRVLPDETLSAAVTASSDDRGAYRIFGLTAGTYVVSASMPVPAGRGEIVEMTADAIDRKLAALRARRAPTPQSSSPPASAPPAATTTLAPVFHPRAFSVADAAHIAVGFGDDRSGVDILLDRVPAVVVAGTVVGAPAGTAMTIALSPPAGSLPAALAGRRTLNVPAGTSSFQFTNVVPGRYVVNVSTLGTMRPLSWSQSGIDVIGADLRDLVFTLMPALRLTGRIVFDATRLTPPADLASIRVMLEDSMPRPAGPAGGGRGTAAPSEPTTDAQGNFVLDGVMPGTYRVRTSFESGADGWWLRSAVVNGQDVMDIPLRVEPDTPLTGAVLTLSDRHTELSGRLEVPAHDHASNYTIVIFPEDRTMRLPRARRIQSARPGTDGTYLFRDLPPGSYRLAALMDVGPEDLMDAAFLDALVAASIPVTLGEGERKTQSLRVAGS